MLEKESEVRSLLDPRTKLLLVLTIAMVVIGGSNLGIFGWGKHLLSAVPFCCFCWRSGGKPPLSTTG